MTFASAVNAYDIITDYDVYFTNGRIYFFRFTGKFYGTVKVTPNLLEASALLRMNFITRITAKPDTRNITVKITCDIHKRSLKLLKTLAKGKMIGYIPDTWLSTFLEYFQISERMVLYKRYCMIPPDIEIDINRKYRSPNIECTWDIAYGYSQKCDDDKVYIILPKYVRNLYIGTYDPNRYILPPKIVIEQYSSEENFEECPKTTIENIILVGTGMVCYTTDIGKLRVSYCRSSGSLQSRIFGWNELPIRYVRVPKQNGIEQHLSEHNLRMVRKIYDTKRIASRLENTVRNLNSKISRLVFSDEYSDEY